MFAQIVNGTLVVAVPTLPVQRTSNTGQSVKITDKLEVKIPQPDGRTLHVEVNAYVKPPGLTR